MSAATLHVHLDSKEHLLSRGLLSCFLKQAYAEQARSFNSDPPVSTS